MRQLYLFLEEQRAQGRLIYPADEQIFAAFKLTPLDQVKVIILGQDPYHGAKQAHGLSFSVAEGTPIPPSLKNIFKELVSDLDIPVPSTGDLTPWGRQGVLLLNSILTVEHAQAGSHRDQGWETFTDQVICTISEQCRHAVFVLWGTYAQSKASLIDASQHLVLCAPHPSPLSAYRGFFGSRPFSAINRYRKHHELPPIEWQLP